MTRLPQGWAIATLDELAATSLGKMLDAKQQTGSHPTPYLRNINVRWGTFDVSDVAVMDVAPHELERVLAVEGDVIACEGGEPGRAAVWRGEPIALQKALHRIRPAEGVSAEYLALGLRAQASTGELARLFTGTTIKHLPQEKLRLVQLPLAPEREQERIVVAIEEAFSKLDSGEAGLRYVGQLLKRLRDAILAAAVAGRLVPQDPTDTPVEKLLTDHAIEPLKDDDLHSLPPGWSWVDLDSLNDSSRPICYGILKPGPNVPDGVPFVEVRSLRGGRIDPDTLPRASSTIEAGFSRSRLRPGDLTLAIRGTTGRVAVVPPTLVSGNVSRDCARIAPIAVSADYLQIYIRGPLAQRFFEAKVRGVAVKGINIGHLRQMPVAVPPAEEQGRIVAEVERQVSFVEACERAVDAGLKRSAALRRSVLKSAFEGRLVSHDPTDEPASVLLERIRDERAAAPKAKSRRAGVKA